MKLFPPPRAERATTSLSGGSSDALGRGMEMTLTLLVFLGLGWLLDRWLGTSPVFTIVLTLLAAIGQFTHMKYAYDAEMERLEAEHRDRRRAQASPMEDAA